jgi:hypothetical protein
MKLGLSTQLEMSDAALPLIAGSLPRRLTHSSDLSMH